MSMKIDDISDLLQGSTHRDEYLEELSLQSTHAAIVIGDNWVAAAKVHVDVLGSVYPFRWQYEFIHTVPDATPSLKAIREALRCCWKRLNESGNTAFSKMFVCLPGWACITKVIDEQIILDNARNGESHGVVITDKEVAELISKAEADRGQKGYVVAECIPRHFVVENGRKTDDPVGEMAPSLAMQAHLVLADRSVMETIRDTLSELDVTINVMKSPYTALRGNFSEAEREGAALFVDVDRLKTYCSFVAGGEFLRMSDIAAGSCSILEGAAEGLNLTPGELADWVNEWEEHVQWAKLKPEDYIPGLAHSEHGPESFEALDEAAGGPAGELFGLIYEKLKFVNARERVHINRVILVGDDFLTLRALKQAGKAYLGIACTQLVPDRVHNAERIQMPGLARMVGLVRQEEHATRRAQPYLARGTRNGMDRFNTWFRNRGAGLAKRAGRSVAGALKCSVAASLAAGTHTWARIRTVVASARVRRRRPRHPLPRPSLRDRVLIR